MSWSEKSVYSEIEIEDEGNGISDEELPHIFERFYRGKTARHSGFGIGMAMAQSIFAKQNGTIKAQKQRGGRRKICHSCAQVTKMSPKSKQAVTYSVYHNN